ncbi:U3 small nucleolar RNA-associated protein 18 homolog [Liolophura sinensis]|uniref:U3 small nucleolar RNA-associated protein 18 homolog n=1 Tax=Liolophura sinensis TaxID=3198878 RepID=UPI0031595A7A
MFRRALKRSNIDTKDESSGIKTVKAQHTAGLPETLGDVKEKRAGEEVLERLVLGGEADVVEQLSRAETQDKSKSRKAKKSSINLYDEEGRKPAWEDDEADNRVIFTGNKKYSQLRRGEEKEVSVEQYTERLKSQFDRVSGTPSWAKLGRKEEQSDEDSDVEQLTTSTGNYIVKSDSLPKSILEIKRCTDANRDSPCGGKLMSVEFHPSAQVILTAGTNNTLSLFQVDGKHNPKIQSVFIDNNPILCAHFSASGEEVIMGSKHSSFHYYDMIGGKIVRVPKIKGLEENAMKKFIVSPDGRYLVFLGKYGHLHLLSAKSKEWIHTLKMNGSVEAAAFSKDGHTMFSHGDDGQVYVWDMNTRDCVHRFVDDGCMKGTSLATSPNGQYLACGSYSGVVNVYETSTCMASQNPQPLKALMNLTTACTEAVFNAQSEILALASDYTEKAVKLVHFPSLTVFSNFPNRNEAGLRIPKCLGFSAHSGYFTIGTHKGTALLYRLKHYGNY